MSQSEYEAFACDRRKARENAHVQVVLVVTDFGSASHWLKVARFFLAKFDTQLKITPSHSLVLNFVT